MASEVFAFDPLTQDPPPDPDHPAYIKLILLPSGAQTILAKLYAASGIGPHPTVLLLHGMPGTEDHTDLAQVFRRAGWHVLFIHYRGAWGSPGTFSLQHMLADVSAALDYLESEAATAHRVDPGRVIAIGHSMGGFAGMMTAARDPRIRALVFLAGFNVGFLLGAIQHDAEMVRRVKARMALGMNPLRGVTAEEILEEAWAHADAWNLMHLGPQLLDLPILMVAGGRDDLAPPAYHHQPLIAALHEAGVKHLTHVELDANHSFSDHRLTLARLILNWIQALSFSP